MTNKNHRSQSVIRTFKHYTSSLENAINILKSGYFKTDNTIGEMNDLSEKQLIEKMNINKNIYCFCFSLRKQESIPMWKMYSKSNGCLLYFKINKRTNFSDFFIDYKNENKFNKHGKIHYKRIKDFNKLLIKPELIDDNDAFLIKRSDFDFENEYRFVSIKNQLNIAFSKCETIRIIYLNKPNNKQQKEIENISKKIGVNIEVIESSMLQICSDI